MALFGFGKKKQEERKTACACGNEWGISGTKNARFIVLGACCKKSKDTFENVKTAVKELGFSDEVWNIGDNLEIAKYGVLSTPALVIENKVVSSGQLLKTEDAKRLIEKAGIKP